MSLNRPAPLAALLTLALAACSPSAPPPAPTVASVSVMGPSNGGLQIGQATPLTATAKDASGNTLSGKTFTWTSSDDSVASVDAGGNVTAKRFGNVTLTATTGGVAGSSLGLKTYGLEAVGGTRTGVGNTSVGTALLYRFRKVDGTGSTGAATLTLTGPSGWNGGQGVSFQRTLKGQNNWSAWSSIAPLTGTYTLAGTVDGTAYSTRFAISDVTQTLGGPTPLTLSAVGPSSVTGTWSSVTGAAAYSYEIYNETDKVFEKDTEFFTGNLSGKIDGLNLDKAKTYNYRVHAFSTNFCCTDDFSKTFPAQFNVSFNQVKITLP